MDNNNWISCCYPKKKLNIKNGYIFSLVAIVIKIAFFKTQIINRFITKPQSSVRNKASSNTKSLLRRDWGWCNILQNYVQFFIHCCFVFKFGYCTTEYLHIYMILFWFPGWRHLTTKSSTTKCQNESPKINQDKQIMSKYYHKNCSQTSQKEEAREETHMEKV